MNMKKILIQIIKLVETCSAASKILNVIKSFTKKKYFKINIQNMSQSKKKQKSPPTMFLLAKVPVTCISLNLLHLLLAATQITRKKEKKKMMRNLKRNTQMQQLFQNRK